MKVKLRELAYARSGDKGASANVGVIARRAGGFRVLQRHLTAGKVREWFRHFEPSRVERYELPNLGALNFLLYDVLDGGGSVSLRCDAQGKALGQRLLEMELEIADEDLLGVTRE